MRALFADRIGGSEFGVKTGTCKFEAIKKTKREAREENPSREIIDIGVGEPDVPADSAIVDALVNEAGKPENRFYADNGIDEFKHAAAAYLSRVYGVDVAEPSRQIVHGIGSKPILAMLPLAFVNPGDIVLQPSPGYPVLATHARYLGGKVVELPLREANSFLPDLSEVRPDLLGNAKILYLNYPNNPTGAGATREYFESVLDTAARYGFLVVHDAAYAPLTFQGPPLSILSIPGAQEHAVEIHSLSKAYNMTGWRLAFIAGKREYIDAYAAIKDNYDSGQFRAIQKAGVYALNHTGLIDVNRERYRRRFELLIPALRRVGFDIRFPDGSFFCYARIPGCGMSNTGETIEFGNAESFSDFLIRSAGISTVPWDDAGAYVRMSVTFEAESSSAEVAVIDEIERRLMACRLDFRYGTI